MAHWAMHQRDKESAELASYMDGVPVRRAPMRVTVKCSKPGCRHRGVAVVPDGKPLRFRCSKCGSRLAVPVV